MVIANLELAKISGKVLKESYRLFFIVMLLVPLKAASLVDDIVYNAHGLGLFRFHLQVQTQSLD